MSQKPKRPVKERQMLQVTISTLPPINGEPVWRTMVEHDPELSAEEVERVFKVALSTIRWWRDDIVGKE